MGSIGHVGHAAQNHRREPTGDLISSDNIDLKELKSDDDADHRYGGENSFMKGTAEGLHLSALDTIEDTAEINNAIKREKQTPDDPDSKRKIGQLEPELRRELGNVQRGFDAAHKDSHESTQRERAGHLGLGINHRV